MSGLKNTSTQVFESKPADFQPKVEIAATYVNVDGKLLLLELSSHKSEAGAWGVPAGKIDSHELPIHGAKRELFEETGIDITLQSLKSLGQLYIRKPEIDYVYHLFGLRLEKLPNVQISNEHQKYKWASAQEAKSLKLMNGAQAALDFYHRLLSC